MERMRSDTLGRPSRHVTSFILISHLLELCHAPLTNLSRSAVLSERGKIAQIMIMTFEGLRWDRYWLGRITFEI